MENIVNEEILNLNLEIKNNLIDLKELVDEITPVKISSHTDIDNHMEHFEKTGKLIENITNTLKKIDILLENDFYLKKYYNKLAEDIINENYEEAEIAKNLIILRMNTKDSPFKDKNT